MQENEGLKKDLEKFEEESLKILKDRVKNEIVVEKGINMMFKVMPLPQPRVKDLAFQLKGEYEKIILVIGGVNNGKPHLTVLISDTLVKEFGLHAGQIVKEAAREIKGGGGGQPFFATAGGSETAGIEKAVAEAERMIKFKLEIK